MMITVFQMVGLGQLVERLVFDPPAPMPALINHLGAVALSQLAYASVHLAAIRYLLLFEAMLRNGQLSYGEIRDRETGRLQILTYAALLWQLFRALIEGALDGLVRDLGRSVVRKILAAIDQTVEQFLTQALQMNPQQVSVQLKAEQLGYL